MQNEQSMPHALKHDAKPRLISQPEGKQKERTSKRAFSVSGMQQSVIRIVIPGTR